MNFQVSRVYRRIRKWKRKKTLEEEDREGKRERGEGVEEEVMNGTQRRKELFAHHKQLRDTLHCYIKETFSDEDRRVTYTMKKEQDRQGARSRRRRAIV